MVFQIPWKVHMDKSATKPTITFSLDLSSSKTKWEGLADVICMHEVLTNQMLLFISETASSNTLASVCKTNTGAVFKVTETSHSSGGWEMV